MAYGRMSAVDAIGGRSQQGLEWANQAIDLAREIGVDNIVRPLSMRALARIDLGDPNGIADLRAALQLSLDLGLPALALPCGFQPDGMPAALQLVARPFAEGLLLRAGHRYQQATDWHRRAPRLAALPTA